MSAFQIIRATLSPEASNLGALLADAGDRDSGHRLVWTLFPGDNSKRDFIYRAADSRTYLIVSKRPAVDTHRLWRLDSKPYAPEPAAGERYSFILRANPSMDISRTGERSERVDAIMHAKRQARERGASWCAEDEQKAALSWLFAREASLGVCFVREACAASRYAQSRIARGTRRAPDDIRHSTVDFEGMLDVTDSALLTDKLQNGVGRARAFGCGLMLVRRV